MTSILAYCRPGYEADTAQEITERAAILGIYGYCTFDSGQGFINFKVQNHTDADRLGLELRVSSTIFARQLIVAVAELEDLDTADRISPIVEAVASFRSDHWQNGLLFVEHADTEEGKDLAKFCRKFAVPLRQSLRKHRLLTFKEKPELRAVHVFFCRTDKALVGYSYPDCRSEFANGICRLKFPSSAPSRSTLKLEEAILTMLTAAQQQSVFRAGGRAVDLGACPGGWTYQLVQRGQFVEAVDNGSIDDALMASGQVEHFAADGFTYRPQFGRVDLLVCDMIEQPERVAKLMGDWLVKGWAEHAIFNLKLPMKRRYETVTTAIDGLQKRLQNISGNFNLNHRHLYHDRDEITVTVIRQ
ncbi:23S rRNA (cytidine(2498)-2'-O)-methyltransferase RlmM [Alteromonas pelagimontana]|uniref:Ribosomal RNA large subunit methyltransferase M n=1 Tax=Alteromonas pelagimontana TaxID=1858656 RepID=A0A6M4M923_9ALTE|nr:23S rRNA (cytidine(2498)-2'-O)-methyltransferase RlmM [Alteromonas pelagimontana]QJR79684.1 23S rRNA (cytidine(2498)-2'-O)-methyltransferase RlmM [Alteromonas pelagimontana]